ncbi:MAG TPA: hypothetical protein VK588_15210 [Chitinophagaceae bacterium]|nr:hypothetical protein [Chitinophagaceae bacterium]
MRITFSILCFLFILNAAFIKKDIRNNSFAKWVVEKNSSINIQGETNINSFQCDVTEYLGADTLVYLKNDATKKLSFTNSCLLIDVRRFDCHNKFITDDFRSALKADENPTLKILFLSIDQFPNSCTNQIVKGIVDVELAHSIKRTEIDYTVKTLPGNRIQVNGSHIFSFSDFNLKAPRKMAGLIRTKDQIKVNFQLFFKAI